MKVFAEDITPYYGDITSITWDNSSSLEPEVVNLNDEVSLNFHINGYPYSLIGFKMYKQKIKNADGEDVKEKAEIILDKNIQNDNKDIEASFECDELGEFEYYPIINYYKIPSDMGSGTINSYDAKNYNEQLTVEVKSYDGVTGVRWISPSQGDVFKIDEAIPITFQVIGEPYYFDLELIDSESGNEIVREINPDEKYDNTYMLYIYINSPKILKLYLRVNYKTGPYEAEQTISFEDNPLTLHILPDVSDNVFKRIINMIDPMPEQLDNIEEKIGNVREGNVHLSLVDRIENVKRDLVGLSEDLAEVQEDTDTIQEIKELIGESKDGSPKDLFSNIDEIKEKIGNVKEGDADFTLVDRIENVKNNLDSLSRDLTEVHEDTDLIPSIKELIGESIDGSSKDLFSNINSVKEKVDILLAFIGDDIPDINLSELIGPIQNDISNMKSDIAYIKQITDSLENNISENIINNITQLINNNFGSVNNLAQNKNDFTTIKSVSEDDINIYNNDIYNNNNNNDNKDNSNTLYKNRTNLRDIKIPDRIRSRKNMLNDFNDEPNKSATRAEVSQLMYNLINQNENIDCSSIDEFDDIDKDHSNAKAIAYLVDNNILPKDRQNFHPDVEISRADVAQLLFGVLKNLVDKNSELAYGNRPVDITDIDNNFACEAIKHLVSNGIVEGYPDKTFKPDKKATRQEITLMIMRTFDL
jgi:predicted  nucleic acid-binding Zn-ribbon protein